MVSAGDQEQYAVAAAEVVTGPAQAYPLHFPRNQWYVIARSAEVDRTLRARTVLGTPLCLYRTAAGRVVALVDRCPHRQFPLSLSRLVGDDVECGYHGLVIDADGSVISAPFQERVPADCRVRSFPVVESGQLVWAFMGDPAGADPAAIPAHEFLDDPGWAVVHGTLHVGARAQLMNENLLDLSHVQFLHPESIGADDVAAAPTQVEHDERSVRVVRNMVDAVSPPLFVAAMGLTGRIDRFQTAEFFPPGFHITHLTAQPTGRPAEACTHNAVHCITPETERSAHYFWLIARDYRVDDPAISELFQTGIPQVFAQDIVASEAIERNLAGADVERRPDVNLRVDGGALRARRMIREQLAAERRGTGS